MTSTPLLKKPQFNDFEPSPSVLIKQLLSFDLDDFDDDFLVGAVSASKFTEPKSVDIAAAIAAVAAPPAPPSPARSPSPYKLHCVLGLGSFAKVLLATAATPASASADEPHEAAARGPVAIKAVDRAQVLARGGEQRVFTEVDVLRQCESPFVVRLLDTFKTPTHVCIVLEFEQGGELYQYFNRHGKLDAGAARFYAAQCVLGLEALHGIAVVFRDLKLENVMLTAKGNVKLCDLGLCRQGVTECDRGAMSYVGTVEYLAPELIKCPKHGHGLAVDWWALGVLIFELLDGYPPFWSDSRDDMLAKILTQTFKPPARLPEDVRATLLRLLDKDPRKRLGSGSRGALEVKQSPFFAGFEWTACQRLELPPPMVPRLASPLDTAMFDQSFTSLPLSARVGGPPARLGARDRPDRESLWSAFPLLQGHMPGL
jgi:serine/threonine protein kinase